LSHQPLIECTLLLSYFTECLYNKNKQCVFGEIQLFLNLLLDLGCLYIHKKICSYYWYEKSEPETESQGLQNKDFPMIYYTEDPISESNTYFSTDFQWSHQFIKVNHRGRKQHF
jgi:hypothetical protein